MTAGGTLRPPFRHPIVIDLPVPGCYNLLRLLKESLAINLSSNDYVGHAFGPDSLAYLLGVLQPSGCEGRILSRAVE